MSPETLFSAANLTVLAGWLALLAAPYRSGLPRLVAMLLALGLSMLYAGLIGAFWTQGEGSFRSLGEVAALFGHPGLLLAGWVHYLAFDLLVGLWEREEARRIGLSRWQLAPCLLLTFLFGPLGWLAFMALRHFRLQTVGAGANPSASAA
jgi:hypothetical protein